jgi:RecJ-like exonuclease
MDENKITCVKCNGQGLISTGAHPLELGEGNTITCDACDGTGKVVSSDVSNVDNASPKVPGDEVPQDTGAGSDGQSSDVPEKPLGVPQIGDPCEMEDRTLGVLDKDADGKWICVPKPVAQE